MNKKISLGLVMMFMLAMSLVVAMCPSGTTPVDVETVTVPSDGSLVTSTNALDNGVMYLLEASGTANAGDTIDFDAKYSITNRISGDTWTDVVSGYVSYGSGLLELKVNGNFIDWGVYNAEHIYQYLLTGNGNQATFDIYDIYYPNNVGSLTVNIDKCVDITAPIITFVEPIDGSIQSGLMHLKATCNEDCDYVNFWWRAEGEPFAWYRYHYVHTDGTLFEWDLDTLDAQLADGNSYVMEDGTYYLYAAGKDLAGNWARTPEVMVVVDNTAPIVTIEAPEEGDIISGIVDIYGTIEENYKLSHYNIAIYPGDADFRDFSKRLEQETVYRADGFDNELIYDWDTTTYPDGEYLIRLAARDKAGNRLYVNPFVGEDDSEHVIRVIVLNNQIVRGGGHMLEKVGNKRKDWLDVSFGGLIGRAGNAGLVGEWQINFHNVGVDELDKSKFHTTEITSLNIYPPSSNTCTGAMNFYANGELDGVPGYRIIFRAGDSSEPSSANSDTVRVELYKGSKKIYDTFWSSEFGGGSSCVGTARTGLDTGNIIIQG